MRQLDKEGLLTRVQRALRECGACFERTSPRGEHPAYFDLYEPVGLKLRVYIWNITHGGATRPADEYRIQVTGVGSLLANDQHKTLILGWRNGSGIFAAWDPVRHAGPVSSSPSMQIKEETLQEAALRGVSLCYRGEGEITVAFTPSMFLAYVQHQSGLHVDAHPPEWVQEVNEAVTRASESASPLPMPADKADPRERTVTEVARIVRDSSFRSRVLGAYAHSCAACGLQLDLVEAAHIVPVRHAESTDETPNGLCLCALHHKAMDQALIRIEVDYRLSVNPDRLEDLREARRIKGLKDFTGALRDMIKLPPEPKLRPNPEYIKLRNSLKT